MNDFIKWMRVQTCNYMARNSGLRHPSLLIQRQGGDVMAETIPNIALSCRNVSQRHRIGFPQAAFEDSVSSMKGLR